MNRSIAFFILFLFSFHSAGHYLIYLVVQLQAKNEMANEIRSHIHNDKLHLITVTDQQKAQMNWSWFDNDTEFESEGVMYDVVRSVKHKGFTSYYCISDEEETRLSDALGHLVDRQASTNKKIKGIYKTIKKNYCLSADHLLPQQTIQSADKMMMTFVGKKYLELSLDILIPPPKLV